MKYLLAFFAPFPVLAQMACTPIAQLPVDPAVGEGLARIEVNVQDADKNVTDAKPHADADGKVKLDAASANLADALAELAKTKDAQKQSEANFNKVVQDNQRLADALAAEKNHWFGAKTRNLVKVIAGIAASVVVLQIVLGVFGLAGASGFHTILAYLARALGLIVPTIGAAINWVFDHLWLKKQTKASPATA